MFYVYMLASKLYGTLYVGTTSDLMRRIFGAPIMRFGITYRVI